LCSLVFLAFSSAVWVTIWEHVSCLHLGPGHLYCLPLCLCGSSPCVPWSACLHWPAGPEHCLHNLPIVITPECFIKLKGLIR
jgi:hypothetical protein